MSHATLASASTLKKNIHAAMSTSVTLLKRTATDARWAWAQTPSIDQALKERRDALEQSLDGWSRDFIMEDVASVKHTAEENLVNATAFCKGVSKPAQELAKFANNVMVMARSFPC